MAPPHGARPGNTDARALSFLVQDAGTAGVNGVYIRSGSQNQGADVFMKKGTHFALFRRKENHWSLADLGGGTPDRWNLRCTELYKCDRIPGGFVPPDFGWKISDGQPPCPFIFAAKNPDLRLTLPRMQQSESAPQLAPKRPLSRLDASGQVFGDKRKDELSKMRSAPVGSASPLFASSHAALTAGLARQGTAGHVNFILAYSVVLARPNNRISWGCKWKEEEYQDTGSRDIEFIEDGSPVARWNTWQSIRGRPDVCVLPGDRLLKVDGRWAYFELEIGGNDVHELDDPSHALQKRLNSCNKESAIIVQSAYDGSKAGKPSNNTVYDFARREVLRPMPPGPPKVTIPESEALLEVSWTPLAWHPTHIAWAVIVQDVSIRMWYTIDAAGTARPRQNGEDVGAIRGDMNFVTVLKGLTQGRTYAACVAVFTEYGWSAFSALSRAVTLTAQMTISEVLLEDFEHPAHAIDPDAWPDRPRYVVPVRVIPGATAPVALLPGPNTFMASRRRLQMKVVCPTIEGLELGAVDFVAEISRQTTEESIGLAYQKVSRTGCCLVVTGISQGGLIDEWNRVNAPEVRVKRGDRIMAVNSARMDMDRMLRTLEEAVGYIRLTIVRGPPKPKDAVIYCGDCGEAFGKKDSYCHTCNARRPKEPHRAHDDEERQILRVEDIRTGSPAARWLREAEQEAASFHGTPVGRGLRIGDKIMRINGVSGAAKMVAEIQRKPAAFAMTVERVLGHDLEGTDAAISIVNEELKAVKDMLLTRGVVPKRLEEKPEMQEKREQLKQLRQQHMREVGQEWMFVPHEEEIFEVDSQLDGEAVKLAEEVQFNCLLPPDEGELAMAIVGSEMEQLEISLEAVLRLSQEATIAAGNRPPRYTFPSLVNDAELRVLLFDRRAKTDNDRSDMLQSSGSQKRQSFTGEPPEMEDAALTALKAALVDVRSDPHELVGAVQLFDKASPAVRASPAAKKMLKRAETLTQLWTWRDNFIIAKERVFEVVTQALDYERERMDIDSDSDDERKPYDVAHLDHAIEEAQEFASEMVFELVEANEIKSRQTVENTRQKAKQHLHLVLTDPREDKATLKDALDKCKEASVHETIVEAGNDVLEFWERKHKRDKAREAIRKALVRLEEQLRKRERPGAGSDEQKIVRDALEEAHLDPDDPLNLEANDLLAQWKTSNSVLRAEAKLHSAVVRATGGWKHAEPRAGDLLGSAIAQVATEGVDYMRLEEARETLTQWEISRQKKAQQELDIAMQYGDVEHLKESIAFALQAGFSEEYLRPHNARLERLRYEEEINKMLTEAFDGPIDTPLLEKCVAYAHHHRFVEDESTLLCSATMQLNCRIWTEELRLAIQSKCADGLSDDVAHVQEIVERCNVLLGPEKEGGMEVEPEIARYCLERDLRSLNLLIPSAADMAAVHKAEGDLMRVLGAVERYAEDLPAVIENGSAQIGAGLREHLLHDAMEHKKAYDHNIHDLQHAIDPPKDAEGKAEAIEGQKVKNCLIKAFLAGAPHALIVKAWKVLEEKFPEVHTYAQTELELLVALAEADDIEEMSVESRFLRLQNAADEARKLNPPLIPDTWTKVDETSLALAAERTLVTQIADSQVVLSGMRPATAADSQSSSRATSRGQDGGEEEEEGVSSIMKAKPRKSVFAVDIDLDGTPTMRSRKSMKVTSIMRASFAADVGLSPAGSPDHCETPSSPIAKKRATGAVSAEEVEKMAEGLGNACISAEQSALDEAKKLIPTAEELRERLLLEASIRREALQLVTDQAEQRQGSSKDLRMALIGARLVSVPHNALEDAYHQLRDMKVAFLSEDMNAALAAGHRTLAIACWFRAQALKFEGLKQKDATLQDFFGPGGVADIVTVQSMMKGERCGGSYGMPTWRQNPQFAIRYSAKEQERLEAKLQHKDHSHHAHHAIPTVSVTVAVAEGGELPATLSVHVVRNSVEATTAGCRWLLAPGYEVLASSDINDDLPTVSFELPPSDDSRPVFIVPSSAKGEEGPFTVVVEGSAPIDMIEVEDSQRDLWNYQVDQELEWSEKMPFRKNLGGGRFKKMAPPLMWYQNPQFRVRLKSRKQIAIDRSAALADASAPSALVAQFPFSGAVPASPDAETATQDSSQLDSMASTAQGFHSGDTVHVRVDVLHASNFTDVDWIADTEIFCKCEIKGRGQELFRTKAVSGSDTPTWNYTHLCKDFGADDTFIFTLYRRLDTGEDEQIGELALPFVQFKKGLEGAVGMVSQLRGREDETDKSSAGTGFWGQLHLKVAPIEVAPASASIPATPASELPSSAGIPGTAQSGLRDISTTSNCRRPAGGQASLAAQASEGTRPSTSPEAALLQVRLMPQDSNQKIECAVHIVKNHSIEDKRINENPYYHEVIGSSCPEKASMVGAEARGANLASWEYLVASEVGCVCKLIHGATEDDEGEPVHVIPSLETRWHFGKFNLQLLATEDVIVERVN